MVVDSNYLQSGKLIDYLSKPENQVILPDQVSYEAFGSDIYKSLRILSRYPNQVLILKRTNTVTKQSFRGSGLQKRMIDYTDTKRFKRISKQILNPSLRTKEFLTSINIQQTEVREDLERIKNEASKMGQQISDYFSPMTKQEAKHLRASLPYNSEVQSLLFTRIEKMTLQVLSGHSNITRQKNCKEFYNSYLFRSCVCFYFLAQEWHLNGGLTDVKPKTMMNDMLDMQIAAYATYFDGFLSNDLKAKRIYKISNDFIKATIEA